MIYNILMWNVATTTSRFSDVFVHYYKNRVKADDIFTEGNFVVPVHVADFKNKFRGLAFFDEHIRRINNEELAKQIKHQHQFDFLAIYRTLV